MDIFTRNDLEILIRQEQDKAVSIYMPTRSAGRNTQQNHIRFKNAVKEAERFLLSKGMPFVQTQEFMLPALRLMQNFLFWQFQSEGIAVFISRNLFRYYRLPIRFDEVVVVNERFHIKPLVPFLVSEGKYYVLSLSKNSTRFFQCTPYGSSELSVPSMPKSLGDALKYEVFEPHGRYRASAVSRLSRSGVIYHGYSGDQEASKDELFRYFRMIDRSLHNVLHNESAPLVLACVEYYGPLYSEANTYPHLLQDMVGGNVERMHSEELRVRSHEIVKPYFARSLVDALGRYNYLSGSGSRLAVESIKDIILHSFSGRVDTLFPEKGAQLWGVFDPVTKTARFHGREEPGDADLIDLAVTHTLLHSGKVYPLDPGVLQDKQKAAAILRY